MTKTKPSHHRSAASAPEVKEIGPTTSEGRQLSVEVQNSSLPEATKSALLREITEYEAIHGRCTKTFSRKIRKQTR